MKPTIPTQQTPRNRRIGRKVLQADRLARALGSSTPKKTRNVWKIPTLQPRITATICAIVLTVGVLGYGASQMYIAKAAESQKVAAAAQDAKLKARSDAADACRRKKAEQKADLIGKVTYDELYDFGECDK